MKKTDKRKSAWEQLQSLRPEETVKFRDVYRKQNFGQAPPRVSKTMTSRIIANVAMTIFFFFIFYVIASLLQWFGYLADGGNTGVSSFLDTQGIAYSFGYFMRPTVGKVLLDLVFSAVFYAVMYAILYRNMVAQNQGNDMIELQDYPDDQHIQLPEEMQRNYDWFPDVGATSSVQVSSLISHVALTNRGLRPVEVSQRAETDILDEDGEVVYWKGEELRDDGGNILTREVPMLDIPFMHALYDASGIPRIRTLRQFFAPTAIPYNPGGSNRDKLKYETVADLINGDWKVPWYEPQRPAGAYLVDTAPVNTMILAITRAGKGQTVIEPTLDMWTRERRLNNMVINDPKGELLVKFYVRGTVRGFQIIQFNLINAVKTDIYNPLGLAAESAREGDFTKVASYVGNIAEVFFPVDNAEEPMWPNAANNAFKRAAYGMIDYYLEEEKELRAKAELTGMDEKVLETKVDELWGKVTLYNTYQMFVQLAAKKMKNPAIEFTKKAKAGAFDYLSDDAYQDKLAEVEQQSKLWEDKPELDLLTLYFNATKALPRNSMRELVNNADDALRSMGGAEKMLASVYGIAITAMSFFTDPTISTLTSGTPSQNVDLAGMSFPRCLGVRFHPEFLEQYHLVGMQAKWMSYDDKEFQHPLGDAFYHEDLVSREGWAKYYFEGKYPRDVAYVHLQLVNPKTGMLIRQFYFQFRKSYQTSLDGRYYMTDPILEERIVKNGVLVELRRYKKRDGTIVYRKGKTTFSQMKIKDVLSPDRKKEQVRTTAIIRTLTRYSEKPKMVFLVTPPHLAQYAKLILILIKQLVDLNFDQSYMTKASQKPLLKTRFMLDEVGNLQSEGHGISNFQTFLSIGLGQDQQFTLVLQTLQQLRDVYGDSVDKIIQGNTNNIIFLKSTDDTLLDTLQKMSGKHHVAHLLSKQVSENKARLFMRYEDVVTKTYQVQEEPVISYNDMAFISERNSIVFRAGDSPIWNRNELILPMSWRLFSNTIEHPGHKYSLQTIPTLSSALDFDVRKNQPNFQNMLEKRMAQAQVADQAREAYQNAYGYTDYEITRKDQEVYSDEIMTIIRQMLAEKQEREKARDTWEDDAAAESPVVEPEENPEVAVEVDKAQAQLEDAQKKRYAGGMLSREDLVPMSGTPNHQWDDIIRQSYLDVKGQFWQDHNHFVVTKNGDFCDRDGTVFMREIPRFQEEKDAKKLKEEAEKEVIPSAPRKNVFYYDNDLGEQDLDKIKSYEVTDDFYYYLVTCETWNDFAFGAFEQAMARRMAAD